ncbi:hypothetical protein AEAC466_13865 [Asticcacaulis sp. AC466]|nr:hypothetical protein AEAC466_13865 [Asticcacaulis sp. AC466]
MAFLYGKALSATMAKSSLFNPFALWVDLGMQTAGMMLASAEVITHRTSRMAQSSWPPSAKDTAEFTLMGAEKVEAAMESLQSVALSMMTLNPLMSAQVWRRMSAVQSDLFSLATSATLTQAMARNAKLTRSLRRAATSANGLSDHTATAALKALQPIRSRAMANAKRLGKVSKP